MMMMVVIVVVIVVVVVVVVEVTKGPQGGNQPIVTKQFMFSFLFGEFGFY